LDSTTRVPLVFALDKVPGRERIVGTKTVLNDIYDVQRLRWLQRTVLQISHYLSQ
jgi:hypothetical protein